MATFHLNYPIYDWCRLSVGILLIIAATFAIIKVTLGSRNKFAYLIMSFTELYGIYYMGLALTEAYRHQEYIPGKGTKSVVNNLAYQTVHYLQYQAALSVWIFGVCYWKSAEACSFNAKWLTNTKVMIIGVAVGVAYFFTQTVYYALKLAYFPGYQDETKFNQWVTLGHQQRTIYVSFTVLGTLLTIYSVSKIFYTAKNLRSTSNYNVRSKKTSFIVHAILLAINCVAELLSYFYGRGDFSPYRVSFAPNVANFVILALEFFIQLFIVFICVTLGANKSLSRFSCQLFDDGMGGYLVKFIPKKPLPESVGRPYASDLPSERSETLSSEDQ